MERVSASSVEPRLYEDFVPPSDWIREERYDMLIMVLPGFKKQNLKVQLDSIGNLRIVGECHIDGNRWRRFRKEFPLPDNCNTSEIRAKFESDMLTVTLPKLITKAEPASKTPTYIPEPAKNPTLPTRDEPAKNPTLPTRDEPVTPAPDRAEPPKPMTTQSEPLQTALTSSTQVPERGDSVKQANGNDKMEAKREEKAKYGPGGRAFRMKMKRNRLVVNVAVAVILLLAVGYYVSYKFGKVAEAETNEGLNFEL